jgi:hypothetical protein
MNEERRVSAVSPSKIKLRSIAGWAHQKEALHRLHVDSTLSHGEERGLVPHFSVTINLIPMLEPSATKRKTGTESMFLPDKLK